MTRFNPVRRLCAAIAVHAPPLTAEHAELPELVRDACLAAGFDRLFLQEEPESGGVLLVMPTGIHEGRVVRELAEVLFGALRIHNRGLAAGARLRLKLAFHQGPTELGDDGFAGRAVATVVRLCSAADIGAVLNRDSGADLVVVISTALLEDIGCDDSPQILVSAFRPCRVRVDEQTIHAGWRVLAADTSLSLP